MSDQRAPSHLAILVGVSAGAYAISLAAVTGLQSTADSALVAEREPIRQAADAAAVDHDALEAAVDEAARRFAALAARYDAAGQGLTGVESALDSLSARAAALTESTAKMPTRFSLPTVGSAPASSSSRSVVVHTTTRASGG